MEQIEKLVPYLIPLIPLAIAGISWWLAVGDRELEPSAGRGSGVLRALRPGYWLPAILLITAGAAIVQESRIFLRAFYRPGFELLLYPGLALALLGLAWLIPFRWRKEHLSLMLLDWGLRLAATVCALVGLYQGAMYWTGRMG